MSLLLNFAKDILDLQEEMAEDKKALIDQACMTAKDFINIYYERIDKDRQKLAKTYLETATLSWNGNRIDGETRLLIFLRFFENKENDRDLSKGPEVY